ncbi:DeoR/GlpR family DNA-binding transcription regulator [Maribacter sp. TH_r10]|uniref:DeoR family transcriptional regulator n=1 Tax=Maribacter luteus TaxID=2594478 RepID=A0A6I2MLX7_9FLAO|nr:MULTISPECIES: DeoR/GlpR family DNA-binding transcription regulator [Maribacter]MDV7140074.1 DeoR/GlpR family DNA-binding transcription regulator [Maribacter sp. TH_r10]MRX63807.1 DeoR family transcriptional regulator [Maribacter luteus]|tara:strand:+ start:838 stop:1587 length:750 start_codon:yes stop_codon:yes gene_type:complete
MLKEERHQAILSQVELHNRVLLTDIAEKLDVSIDTARRDVKELDQENKLRKVHGGAISLGFTTSSTRNTNIYALPQKITIAEKAATLLKNDAVIFIDGGTTCMEFARIIPLHLKLTCFTMSLPVAMELTTKPKVDVIFIGGKISKESQIAIGANATHALSEIKVDYGFIGTGYVDASDGLTDFDWDVVQVKKAIMKASKKTILLCISKKLNSRHRYKTCDMTAVDTMITELSPDDDQLKLFRNNNVHLI